MIDLYGPLLAKALFPAFEAARGRPTVGLLRSMRDTERWTPGALRDLQLGMLRRLVRHAYRHTVGHLRENHRFNPIRHLWRNLHTAIHGPWMHHEHA